MRGYRENFAFSISQASLDGNTRRCPHMTQEGQITMSSNDLLLGFDAREMWLDPQDDWPPARKKGYLLRDDVAKPLSTDTAVWRTVFDADPSLHRPEWTGP